jgi:hypothetical protein
MADKRNEIDATNARGALVWMKPKPREEMKVGKTKERKPTHTGARRPSKKDTK